MTLAAVSDAGPLIHLAEIDSSMLLQFELALVGFVLSLLTFVAQIALVIWTYNDATDNSSYSAILWALVVLFAPLFGVVLYLLLGRDQQ